MTEHRRRSPCCEAEAIRYLEAASPRQGEPVDLDVAAFGSRVIVVAHHMLRGGYLASEAVALSEARNLVLAAWTGERWDVDPEWRSPEQNAFLAALSTDPAEPVAPEQTSDTLEKENT